MGSKQNARQRGPFQGGQELVEFALVLPVMVLLLVGALDLGRAFHAAISITNVARVGARFGGLNFDQISTAPHSCSAPTTAIVAAACQEAQDSGLNMARTTVDPSCPDDVNGACNRMERLVVTVTYDFDLLMGGLIGIPNIQITRSADMLIQ